MVNPLLYKRLTRTTKPQLRYKLHPASFTSAANLQPRYWTSSSGSYFQLLVDIRAQAKLNFNFRVGTRTLAKFNFDFGVDS